MPLTAHQIDALRYIAAYPNADASCSRVGVRTVDALARLGLVTVTREITSARVRVSAFSARTGSRMRAQCDVSATITHAGLAVLS